MVLVCGRGVKIFSPLRGTNSTTTHCHIFLVQYPDRYHRGCCCGPFEAEQKSVLSSADFNLKA